MIYYKMVDNNVITLCQVWMYHFRFLFLDLLLIHESLPEPVLLPHSLIHVVNRNSLCLRQQEQREQPHHQDPCSEEEEDTSLHVAEHRQESLCNHKCKRHVRAHCKGETSRSCF